MLLEIILVELWNSFGTEVLTSLLDKTRHGKYSPLTARIMHLLQLKYINSMQMLKSHYVRLYRACHAKLMSIHDIMLQGYK